MAAKKEQFILYNKRVEETSQGMVEAFPIPIESWGVERNPQNEAMHRHITFLILPILSLEDNRLLIINKHAKNEAKNPGKVFAPLNLDCIGGHGRIDLVPAEERAAEVFSFEAALDQAYRELVEELVPRNDDSNAKPFRKSDLVFLGMCPYEDEACKEFSVLFGLLVPWWSSGYEAMDDYVEEGQVKTVRLEKRVYYYHELMKLWRTQERHGKEYSFENGLGRILARGDLPQRILDAEFPGERKIDIRSHPCHKFADATCHCALCGREAHAWEVEYNVTPRNAEYMYDNVDRAVCKYCGAHGPEEPHD